MGRGEQEGEQQSEGLNVYTQALIQGESGNEGSIIKQINQDR